MDYKNSINSCNRERSKDFFKVFWMFLIFSFCGFIIETIWCLLENGVLESRQGLIYGPFSQIYGIAAILMIYFLDKIKKKTNINVFLYSCLIGAIFEYLCSFIQEKALGSVSWVYDKSIFGGRICISYTFMWGVLGLLLIRWLYPIFNTIYTNFVKSKTKIISKILLVLMILDILVSVAAVYRQNQRLNNLPAFNKIEVLLDKYYSDKYLKKVYPNMKFGE